MKSRKIDWEEYIDLINRLGDKIEKSGVQFKYIYGIHRGGLIPATILSYRFDKSILTTNRYDTEGVLIVDDLTDSGRTLYRELNGNCITAVLHYKSHSSSIPNFFVEKVPNKTWVVYPYDQIKDTISKVRRKDEAKKER